MSRASSPKAGSVIRSVAGTTIQQRFVFAIGAAAFVVVTVMAWAADTWLVSILHGLPDDAVADARLGVLLGALVLLGLLLIGLGMVSRFVLRSVSAPALRLASLSERVSAGDLTVAVPGMDTDDEMGRLSRATDGMLRELRRLVAAMDDSAARTATMAAEITSGTEQMTGAASEVAHTSNELSAQSTEMSDTVRKAAADAGQLRRIAGELTAGARGGVERNRHLRRLAQENRGRLDASTAAFDLLAQEAELAARSADALADASEEIRAFLSFVRKMARQSKLLGLNASMEAARAGELGDGFAVVANEVRKMALGAAAGAERVQLVVDQVLARVEETRESSRRTLSNVDAARGATREVIDAFGEVERMLVEMDGWTASIDSAATSSAELVEDSTQRLEMLARGIEGFAAAMEQVAATAEEQSASTEEIAAAAAALTATARELSGVVGVFRLGQGKEAEPARATGTVQQAAMVGRLATA